MSAPYLINIGSVEKPKDGNLRAGHVFLRIAGENGRTLDVNFIRAPYDV